MESILKSELGLKICEKQDYVGGGGCISDTKVYNTDKYGKIFVKYHEGLLARLMFEGEYASLKALADTKTVTVPKPISVLDLPKTCAMVMEYVEIKSLRKYQEKLGEEIARLHLHCPNDTSESSNKFGFHITTCCGYIPIDNSWRDDWVTFYARQRLEPQIKLVEKKYGDREAIELWSQLQLKIPDFFKELEIKPSLLHGDLWSGNVSETTDGPVYLFVVIYDPASFWGHHEFDLSIGKMFGGFNASFYNAYHKLIPKATGFEMRQNLYILYHQLNHWNHFGDGYRSSTISLMRSLLK